MPTEPSHRSHNSGHETGGEYVVVARRYRPKGFGELVGQEHVSQALKNAIKTNRVGHAYLFTGARGVGKTSTARIFAKALNNPGGPSFDPDYESDIARSIDAGEDVDVLEIDGASNRGIDEIRQLRSNVNIRPSRARFKIYIIDEVHMLTTQAFNALLKTLEEPPEHVKFIFCTTDPEKIPITVLSRCQRFDFAPVKTDSILGRLKHIVEQEQVDAEDDALQMLARRAGGSMRDSQSLLEQLLSFCGDRITVDDVHSLLGTARSGRLAELSGRLIERDAVGAIRDLDAAIREGVDVGQLAEQLLGHLRDMAVIVVGGDRDMLLHVMPQEYESLRHAGSQIGVATLLAMIQILDHATVRMRHSSQARTVFEMALVRICRLEDLDSLAQLVASVERGLPIDSGGASSARPGVGRTGRGDESPESSRRAANRDVPASASPAEAAEQRAEKKTTDDVNTAKVDRSDRSPSQAINSQTLQDLWQQVIERMEDMTSDVLKQVESLASPAPNRVVVTFPAGYTLSKETCERPDRKAQIERALSEVARRRLTIEFVLSTAAPASLATPPPSKANLRQAQRDVEQHPLLQDAKRLFDAELVKFDPPRSR